RAPRGYDIHTGKPTGREVAAMHRLQVLTDRYIAEGLTPADARTRAREELRSNLRRDWRAGEMGELVPLAHTASPPAKIMPALRAAPPHNRSVWSAGRGPRSPLCAAPRVRRRFVF